MIIQNQTDLYLKDFDLLAEALYLCWYNAFSEATKQIDETILKTQIRTYGFYTQKNVIRKDIPIHFRNKLKFKTLTWVNDFTESIAEDTICGSSEPYKKSITEIRRNLFRISNRADRIANANIILCDLDKSNIHNQEVDAAIRDLRFKEMFTYVLDHNFITEDNVTINHNSKRVYPIYDLTVRLINHFDFIDKLIEAFLCFEINLASINDNALSKI